MNNGWQNLTIRDKRFLSAGIFFIILFLGYEIFFASFSSANNTLREIIVHDKKLLTWMENADQRIQALQHLSKNNFAKNPVELLSILQKELTVSPFQKNVTHLSEAENNSIQLTLQKVNFDALILWLSSLWQKEGITVAQMASTPDEAPGIVDVTILFH